MTQADEGISQTSEVTRRFTKYVFLDIVKFSVDRSAEAQFDIVCQLNQIVQASLIKQTVKSEARILLPTGDGMCIALHGPDLEFDLHILLALDILQGLHAYHESTSDLTRQFQIRIGIDQNTDFLFDDINGNPNLAGAGINLAARIMGLGDGNQILVSQTVFDELQPSERYMNKFRPYYAKVKHGRRIQAHQFIAGDHLGLNVDVPSEFLKDVEAEPRLTRFVAHYLALAIKHKLDIVTSRSVSAPILLYFLAQDALGISKATEIHPYRTKTHGYDELSFSEQLAYYDKQDFNMAIECSKWISDRFSDYEDCFERSGTDIWAPSLVTDAGVEKLNRERPAIWKEFDLDNLT